jgi:two-component system cell cycle response regulator DivK
MKTVLVIEDNETNLYLVRFMLKKAGYKVIVEKEGIPGVEAAINKKPDLVIMDIQLPDIDGLEATRRIRASGNCGNVPIVALTSYAMVGDKEKALAAGCNGYIEKPINPETFITEIRKYL